MYKRYFKMPLIFGTILLPVIILYLVYIEKTSLSFEMLLVWPATVGILLGLRIITVIKNTMEEKGKAAGEKFAENMLTRFSTSKKNNHNENTRKKT